MKLRLALYSFFTLLIFVQANCSHPPSPEKKNAMFVLCDFSSSVDTAATKDRVIKNTDRIFKYLPAGVEYAFYPIGGVASGLLIDGDTGDPGGTLGNVRSKNYEHYEDAKRIIRNQFNLPQHNRTCIVDELESISDMIRSYSEKEKYKCMNVLIISDLMECCEVNGAFLNLEQAAFPTRQADTLIARWPADRKFLSGFKNTTITVVFAAREARYAPLKRFWTKLFKAAGFTGNVVFLPEVSKVLFE